MIEIKRNCSSSVTIRDDKITFGSISITISKTDFDRLNAILIETGSNPLWELSNVIGLGIISEYEQTVI